MMTTPSSNPIAGRFILAGLAMSLVLTAHADVVVVPNDRANMAGTGGNSRLMNNTPGVHQAVFSESQFASLPADARLEGIAWRQTATSTAPWPTGEVVYGEFNIQVSTSLNPPGQLDPVFDANIGPDVVLVRSGPLTVEPAAFPGSTTPPGYAQFGPVIEFTSPYTYEGGDLLITMRRSGFISGAGTAFGDRVSTGDPGYNTLFQGHHRAGAINEQTSQFQTVFIFEITWSPAEACYANCDGSTTEPILTVDDFTCFINEFAAAQSLPPQQQIEHYANCDGSTTEPILTVDDFTCFINAFAAGCP